jgi:hypothetical protein
MVENAGCLPGLQLRRRTTPDDSQRNCFPIVPGADPRRHNHRFFFCSSFSVMIMAIATPTNTIINVSASGM